VFDLDREAESRLRAAADPVSTPPVQLPLRGFSYTSR